MTGREFTTAELLGLSNLMRAKGHSLQADVLDRKADMLAFGRVIGADDEFTPTADCEYEHCGHPRCERVYDVEADGYAADEPRINVVQAAALCALLGLIALPVTALVLHWAYRRLLG